MLNKCILSVPKGVRYISQWEDFKLSNFPDKCIINKQLPGCGFTEFSLTNDENVILPSPRKTLIENKYNQHPDTVYLVVNDYEQEECIDTDTSKQDKSISSKINLQDDIEESADYGKDFYNKLYYEIRQYLAEMDLRELPYKIEVTYDSFRILKEVLIELGRLQDFYVVVDEFQSILDDSRFKPDTELEFLYTLSTVKRSIFVSATPMLDDSISMIDELKDLPYYELDWKSEDSSRLKRPNLKIRTMNSVKSKAKEVIQEYLEGDFEKALVERNGELVEIESREAVFFVNSVNHITSIIKNIDLQPDQVNILCARNSKNRKFIQRKLGKKFNIGQVPLKDEVHKMFTFCTRTVYLGADFYSTNARSFIFSDANSDCLSVDISMDLPQILGRQRLDENPWKNSAEFYYRAKCDWKNMTDKDFQEIIRRKIERTENLLLSYNSTPDRAKDDLAAMYLKVAKMEKYRDNYVGVNTHSGTAPIPKMNNLVYVNDLRTFQIQQKDYADRFSVFTKIREEIGYVGGTHGEVDEFFSKYNSYTTYVDRMKCLCEFSIRKHSTVVEAILDNLSDSDRIKQHFLGLGPKRIMELNYNSTRIADSLGIKLFDRSKLTLLIYSKIDLGKYTKKELKIILGEIYQEVGYNVKPKASDLSNYFDMKECKISIDGKQQAGFELINKKS